MKLSYDPRNNDRRNSAVWCETLCAPPFYHPVFRVHQGGAVAEFSQEEAKVAATALAAQITAYNRERDDQFVESVRDAVGGDDSQ